jgi:phage terminase small subunit
MPVLDNSRHEAFAQHLAKGLSASEAYTKAGYAESRSAASRLSTNVNISARVVELQTKSADRTVLTVAALTERLLAIAEKGESSDEAPLLSVARASLMDAAKLNGLIVDKAITAQTSLEDMLDQLDGKTGNATGAPN